MRAEPQEEGHGESISVVWFADGSQYIGGHEADTGLDFTDERRLGLKLEHRRLSPRVLSTGATDSIELPQDHHGSAEWRPLVDLLFACSINMGPLPVAEQW